MLENIRYYKEETKQLSTTNEFQNLKLVGKCICK